MNNVIEVDYPAFTSKITPPGQGLPGIFRTWDDQPTRLPIRPMQRDHDALEPTQIASRGAAPRTGCNGCQPECRGEARSAAAPASIPDRSPVCGTVADAGKIDKFQGMARI
jgi:hypothetical protein